MSPCAVNVHSSSTLLGPACCSLFWRKIYNQECPLPVILRAILETLGVSRLVKKCPDFTKLEGLSPCSEKPSSALCWTSWIQFTSCFFYRYFNRLLFSHLHRLPRSLFPLDFQANKLCISHAPLCATCAPNLALLDVNNLMTGESKIMETIMQFSPSALTSSVFAEIFSDTFNLRLSVQTKLVFCKFYTNLIVSSQEKGRSMRGAIHTACTE
jgi:hypothetical protein